MDRSPSQSEDALELTYWNLVDHLLAEVPELRPAYEEELKLWLPDKPGPHIVFGDLLTPYLIELLEQNTDIETLRRVFSFLEQVAASSNQHVRDVAGASVLDSIGYKHFWKDRALSYAGPCTRGGLLAIRTKT
jgi:hypothetical protein